MKNSLRLLTALVALSFAAAGFAGEKSDKDQKPGDKKAVVCDCGDSCKNSDSCCCKGKEHKDDDQSKPSGKK